MKNTFKILITLAALVFTGLNSFASLKQLAGERQNNWNTSSNSFAGHDSSSYEYDGSGKIRLQHVFTYNSATGWNETSQTVYTYTDNLLTNKTTYAVNTGSPVNSFKIDYTYNGNGQLSTEAKWLWVSGAWMGINRYTSSYDAQRRLVTYATEGWNAATANWKILRRTQYGTFTGTTATVVIIQTWNQTSSLWTNYQKTDHFLYTGTERDTAILMSYWDAGSSSWIQNNFTTYVYNTDGNIVSQENFVPVSMPGIGTLPAPKWHYTYTYTGTVLTHVYHEVAYNGSFTYTPESVTDYTLDINNHYYLEVVADYDTATHSFVNANKYFFDYDADGDLLHTVTQTWNGTAWINSTENYNWYNAVLSDVEEITATRSLKVYPNPFLQTATVEFVLAQSGMAKIQLYDLNGRLLSQTEEFFAGGTNQWTLNGNDLTTGFYLLKIETGTEKFMQKITRQ